MKKQENNFGSEDQGKLLYKIMRKHGIEVYNHRKVRVVLKEFHAALLKKMLLGYRIKCLDTFYTVLEYRKPKMITTPILKKPTLSKGGKRISFKLCTRVWEDDIMKYIDRVRGVKNEN